MTGFLGTADYRNIWAAFKGAALASLPEIDTAVANGQSMASALSSQAIACSDAGA